MDKKETEKLFSQYLLEKNEEEILKMIKNDPEIVLKIPKESRKEKYIITAIKKDNLIFPKLEEDEKNLKICEISIGTPHGYVCFDSIPDVYKTEEFILRMIDKKGYVISYIDNPTEEMCLRAVKSNPYNGGFLQPQRIDETTTALLHIKP